MPFAGRQGHVILVDVLLDGRPARALVDSGFAGVMLSRSYALANKLPLTPAGSAYSVGGITRYERTTAPRLEAGGVTRTGGTMRVIDLSALDRALERPIDVVLGAPLLARYAVQIDFDQRRLRFLPSGAQPVTGAEVPLRYRRDYRILLDLRIGDAAPVPVMLDLGAEQHLSLAADVPLPPTARATTIAAGGAGGLAVSRLLTLPAAQIGSVTEADVQTAVEGPDAFLRRNRLRGLIGISLLSRHNLLIDVTAGRLILSPRTRREPDPPKSTIGIQIADQGARIEVLHVMANSPAARAGLRDGDTLCAVDGQRFATTPRPRALLGWTIAPPGTRHRVTLCNGREIDLVSEAFY